MALLRSIVLTSCCLLLTPWVLAGPSVLYSIDRVSGALRTIDPSNGATLTQTSITDAGVAVEGANGLAVHPLTGELYGILKLATAGGRHLATIDPVTGNATVIGPVNPGSGGFAGLAFDLEGTLYAISGDGANPPETLFSVDLATATPTELFPLGNGDNGETIAFRPTDNLLYHGSGLSDLVFESVDVDTATVQSIPLSGDPTSEMLALTYSTQGFFFMSDTNSDLFTITTSGFAVLRGTLDHSPKGLALGGALLPVDPVVRGDCNVDGSFDISDVVFFLFAALASPPGTPTPSCDFVCDGNNDDTLDVADAVTMLTALFGTPSVPLPGPNACGEYYDQPFLTCDTYDVCP